MWLILFWHGLAIKPPPFILRVTSVAEYDHSFICCVPAVWDCHSDMPLSTRRTFKGSSHWSISSNTALQNWIKETFSPQTFGHQKPQLLPGDWSSSCFSDRTQQRVLTVTYWHPKSKWACFHSFICKDVFVYWCLLRNASLLLLILKKLSYFTVTIICICVCIFINLLQISCSFNIIKTILFIIL